MNEFKNEFYKPHFLASFVIDQIFLRAGGLRHIVEKLLTRATTLV